MTSSAAIAQLIPLSGAAHNRSKLSRSPKIFHHIPNAQLQIFANATHMIPFDDPDRFNSTVETFLQKPFVKIDRLGDTMKSLEKLRMAPAK